MHTSASLPRIGALPQMRKLFGIAALTLILISVSACSGHKAVPVGTIPEARAPEPTLVKRTVYAVANKEAKEGRKLHQGCKFYKRAKKIVNRLTDGIGQPRDTWPLWMIGGDSQPNAGAVNKSVMVVHESLMVRVTDDRQLAAILAHEIAHILAQHGPDESQDTKATAAKVGGTLLGVVASVGSVLIGIDPANARQLGSLTTNATHMVSAGLILQYDRDQEYEADHIGLMIMAKAGYDPRHAIEFWKNTDKIFGQSNEFGFLSTHPSDDARADNLEEALPIALEFYKAKNQTKRQQAKIKR